MPARYTDHQVFSMHIYSTVMLVKPGESKGGRKPGESALLIKFRGRGESNLQLATPTIKAMWVRCASIGVRSYRARGQMAEGEEQKETLTADRSAEEAGDFLPGFISLEDYSKVIIIDQSCRGCPPTRSTLTVRNQLRVPPNQFPVDQLPTGSTPIKSTSHEINCNFICMSTCTNEQVHY